jgi:hypothetical protein
MLDMDLDDERKIEENSENDEPTAIEIMHHLSTHDFKSAFPNLYLAY